VRVSGLCAGGHDGLTPLLGEKQTPGGPLAATDFMSRHPSSIRFAIRHERRNVSSRRKIAEIEARGVFGDAEILLKALRQSQHFEALLNGSDKAVAYACLKLALPNG
jgi:hypothetical protein